ncbi:MAG TPA: chloride channel protein [Polyangia bacterium]
MVGAACGAASALFLVLLDRATALRESQPNIVYGLPVAGLVMGRVLEALGPTVRRGTSQIIDAINDRQASPHVEVPWLLAPVVLIGTVLTHLFGGSAGREGTAVQMGGALGEAAARLGRAGAALRRQLLLAGVAGGFGSVFGTPLAGTIFALEFAARGRVPTDALLPALVAALIGDAVTRGLGVLHTPYPTVAPLPFTAAVFGKWALFAIAVGATSAAFLLGLALVKRFVGAHLRRLPLAMAVGGLLIIALWRGLGTEVYLGLGVPNIEHAFVDPSLPASHFLGKLLFTLVTVGSGFLGGEVTPLFFVGASLGNWLSGPLSLPLAMSAGVGLVAVFATAANTPVALCVMAVELLGAAVLPHAALVCVIARALLSSSFGGLGLYSAQRPAAEEAGRPPAGDQGSG